jgi:Arc/MetJ-type ribon-helix-helix transcriptional regulator
MKEFLLFCDQFPLGKPITFTLPPDLIAQIDSNLGGKRLFSRSKYVAFLLKKALEEPVLKPSEELNS